MNKTETLSMLRRYLPPGLLAQFLKDWWQWQQEDEALATHLQSAPDPEALAHGQQVDASEPWLEDCPHCGGTHLAGTISLCPLNHEPIGDVVAAYRAMEAALQLLTANILNLRTELLAIKAEVMKDDEAQS